MWRVREPVADEEGLVLREVAVIKYQQELDPFLQPLDGVGDTGREVPDVARADVVNEVAPLGVNGGDTAAAGEHVAPFGLLVPVQLADTSGLEAHVHAGHFGGDRQLTHCYLTRPSARGYSVPGGRIGEFEVGNGTGVGFRRGQ